MRSVLALACLSLLSLAHADERFYVGARSGVSQYGGTADTSAPTAFSFPPPTEISIAGLPFKSDETAWGVYGGWRVKEWLAVEVGFNDLGNTGRRTFAVISPGLAGITTSGVAVDVEELYLGTRFTIPLSQRWNANWLAAITRATFDAEGSLPLIIGVPFFGTPSPVVAQRIPYASPDDETGFVWGFGFGWEFADRWGLDLGYRQHDAQVFDVDSFSVGVSFSF